MEGDGEGELEEEGELRGAGGIYAMRKRRDGCGAALYLTRPHQPLAVPSLIIK